MHAFSNKKLNSVHEVYNLLTFVQIACVLKTVSFRLSKVGTLSTLLLSISTQLSSDFDPVSNPLSVKDPSSGFSNELSFSSSSS